MKICFVVPKVYCYFDQKLAQQVGGSERQVYYLGHELARDDNFEVNYCVADYGQKDIKVFNNVKVWKSFSYDDNIVKVFIKLFKTLKKIRSDLYIFKAASIGTFIGFVIVKLLLRKKFVYMVASDGECSNRQMWAWNSRFATILISQAYKYADILTVQSKQQFYQFISNRKITPDKIIKNVFVFNDNILKNQDKNSYVNKRNSILWVGRCSKIKQPGLFIDLATNFPNFSFVMIAPKATGELALHSECKTLSDNIPNLHFLDFVPPSEIFGYYRNARVYVITSLFEGFSNTMMEAMEARCPILSYNVDPDKIIEKFQLGFCSKGNIGLFYEQFQMLTQDENLCKAMGDNAFEYLKENHGLEGIANEFKELIKDNYTIKR